MTGRRKQQKTHENVGFLIGRCERIRTSDPFLPKEVRYQAALHTGGAHYIILH
jgi:hypothetical protein